MSQYTLSIKIAWPPWNQVSSAKPLLLHPAIFNGTAEAIFACWFQLLESLKVAFCWAITTSILKFAHTLPHHAILAYLILDEIHLKYIISSNKNALFEKRPKMLWRLHPISPSSAVTSCWCRSLAVRWAARSSTCDVRRSVERWKRIRSKKNGRIRKYNTTMLKGADFLRWWKYSYLPSGLWMKGRCERMKSKKLPLAPQCLTNLIPTLATAWRSCCKAASTCVRSSR